MVGLYLYSFTELAFTNDETNDTLRAAVLSQRKRVTSTLQKIQPGLHVMASFFDNRARVAAAATAAASGGPSSKAAPPKENSNVQPWVEK